MSQLPSTFQRDDPTIATVVQAGAYYIDHRRLYTFYALIPNQNQEAGRYALANGYHVGIADLSPEAQIAELEFIRVWVNNLAEMSDIMRNYLYRTYRQHVGETVVPPRCISIYDLRNLENRIIDIYRQVPALQTLLKIQSARLLDTFIGRHYDIMLLTPEQRDIIKKFPNPYARNYALRRGQTTLAQALRQMLPKNALPAFIPKEHI